VSHEGYEIHEVLEPRRRSLGGALSLQNRANLVGNMVMERIGTICGLGQAWHGDCRERWDLVRSTGHGNPFRNNVYMELRPSRRTEPRIDWYARAAGSICDSSSWASLEIEPVATIEEEGRSEISLGLLPGDGAIDIDVNRVANCDMARKERCRALKYPVVIQQIQANQKTVIGELALQVR
jgi:hypothetical protein